MSRDSPTHQTTRRPSLLARPRPRLGWRRHYSDIYSARKLTSSLHAIRRYEFLAYFAGTTLSNATILDHGSKPDDEPTRLRADAGAASVALKGALPPPGD